MEHRMADLEDREIVIAVEVIKDLLDLVDADKRLEVLNHAVANELAERKDREENGLLKFYTFDEASHQTWLASPRTRYWGAIMRFKSLVIQVFTRNITNNHSKEDAAKILFIEHRKGHGSGWLPHYLDGLPSLTVDTKTAATLTDKAKDDERARQARQQRHHRTWRDNLFHLGPDGLEPIVGARRIPESASQRVHAKARGWHRRCVRGTSGSPSTLGAGRVHARRGQRNVPRWKIGVRLGA